MAEEADKRELGVEDWSTIRILCAACSRGSPGPHDCSFEENRNSERRFAIAARTEEEVQTLADAVTRRDSGIRCLGVNLVLPAG
jgi:hypothetical protein